MHSHQQMMWVNSALQVCWVSALAIIWTQTTWHKFTVRRPRVIKPTPLVTGPLEIARLGTNIQSVLHILMWASALPLCPKII